VVVRAQSDRLGRRQRVTPLGASSGPLCARRSSASGGRCRPRRNPTAGPGRTDATRQTSLRIPTRRCSGACLFHCSAPLAGLRCGQRTVTLELLQTLEGASHLQCPMLFLCSRMASPSSTAQQHRRACSFVSAYFLTQYYSIYQSNTIQHISQTGSDAHGRLCFGHISSTVTHRT
jgi:hypothetical protein